MLQHHVSQGECLSSISKQYGFFWQTLWDLPENRKIRQLRQNPNVLFPGDMICIPDKEQKQFPAVTEQRHRFCLKGVPARFRMQFRLEAEPLASEPYRMIIDGSTTHTGKLDANGLLDVPIQPDAMEVTVLIGEGDELLEYRFQLGCIDPIDTLSGIQCRLINLGFMGAYESELGECTREALRRFQANVESLNVTGEPDQATLDALVAAYGS